MARGLPQIVRDNLEKCRAAAVASVDAYNRPGPRFRAERERALLCLAYDTMARRSELVAFNVEDGGFST